MTTWLVIFLAGIAAGLFIAHAIAMMADAFDADL